MQNVPVALWVALLFCRGVSAAISVLQLVRK